MKLRVPRGKRKAGAARHMGARGFWARAWEAKGRMVRATADIAKAEDWRTGKEKKEEGKSGGFKKEDGFPVGGPKFRGPRDKECQAA